MQSAIGNRHLAMVESGDPIGAAYNRTPQGAPPSQPIFTGRVFPVTLIQTGGGTGSRTTPATWTYTVKDYFTDEELATSLNPGAAPHKFQRPPRGQMAKATFGQAFWETAGAVLIVTWVNEMVVPED
jgi:hypothetical protein